MTKRLLFITCHKLDESNGGSNGSKGFIHSFAALFDDCSIIYPHIEKTYPFIPEKYKLYPITNHRTNVRKLFDMYRGVISPLYYTVRQHLKTHQYDVIVIDHSFSGAGVSSFIRSTGAKVITIHHNVERDYLRANAKERPLFYRFPFLYYSKKSERACLQNSDINLTVTRHDAHVFQSWYPHLHLYPWGDFEFLPIEDKAFAPKSRDLTFIITGSLSFVQSLLPIKDFITRYWPLVRQHYPTAQLIISGRNPSDDLRQMCKATEGITLVPNPQDINEEVEKANYYICPINVGSGLKLRIMDGLRHGLPILCHDVSTSGYEGIKEKGYLFSYHDEPTFVESLHKMIEGNLSPDSIFQAYKENFSLNAGINRLHNILNQEGII